MHATSYTHAKPLLGPSIADFVRLFSSSYPGPRSRVFRATCVVFLYFCLFDRFNSYRFLFIPAESQRTRRESSEFTYHGDVLLLELVLLALLGLLCARGEVRRRIVAGYALDLLLLRLRAALRRGHHRRRRRYRLLAALALREK